MVGARGTVTPPTPARNIQTHPCLILAPIRKSTTTPPHRRRHGPQCAGVYGVSMRLVPVVEMATSQPSLLNVEHATLIAPIHLDTKTHLLRKDQQTWAVTFVV